MAEKKKLTKRDYEMALASQSACNLSGVVFEFAETMKRICEEANENGHGTDWKNLHPVCRLYAEQISWLTSKMDYMKAADFCEDKLASLSKEE